MTIIVANEKGGVGKTTTAVNVAAYLAAFGKKVLLMDLDPQGSATSALGLRGKHERGDLYQVLTGDVRAPEAIYETHIRNLHAMPATRNLAGATVELLKSPKKEAHLRQAIEKLYPYYDYMLIDAPPGLGLLTVNGFVASDGVLIPIACDYYGLEGLAGITATIDMLNKRISYPVRILGVLCTMFDKKSPLARAVLKEIGNNFHGKVFNTIIPRNEKLAEAPGFMRTILEHAPYSHGGKAYRAFAEEILTLTQVS